MAKLVVFGDSFASYRLHENAEEVKGTIWFEDLAKKLNLDFVTYGVPGSSFEFSKKEFWKYYNSKEYSRDDIIIFVFTSFQRCPLVSTDIPPFYASNYTAFLQNTLEKHHFAYNHYNEHREMYKGLAKFRDWTDFSDRHLFCLALQQIPNMVVAITAFKDLYINLRDKSLLDDKENFIYINGNLFEISQNEFIKNKEFKTYHQFFGGELRNCHLANSNNLILSSQIAQCIHHRTNKYFDKKKFKTGLVKFDNTDQRQELPYQEYDNSKDYF